MTTKTVLTRILAANLLIFAILLTTIPVSAQGNLIPVNDITGGSGIFVMRSTAQRRVLPSRQSRSKQQRIESTRKVARQYTTLAKTAPRRTRTAVVAPNDARLANVPTMDKGEASNLFAGVGEYHMDRDNYNEAIGFFREALLMNANNKVAQMGLSEALALKGNQLLVQDSYPVALTFFREALTYNPKNAPAYYGLAEVLTQMSTDARENGRTDEAAEREKEAITNYAEALKADADLSEIYTPLGSLYYQKGDIENADLYLTKAVAASPTDPQAHFYLGLVRMGQNRNEEALVLLRKSASLDSSNPEVAFYTGSTLLRTSKNDLAVTEFTKATTLRPNYFEAWMGLGEAQYALGKFAEAATAYERAARLRNTNYEAYNNWGDALRQMSPPQFAKAEAQYNLAAINIKKQPNYNKEEAADMLSKAAFSVAKQCEINIQERKGCRWDAAVRYLEEADQMSTTGIDAANLGWALYNAARTDIFNRKPELARPKLEKAKVALQRVANGNSSFVSGPMLNLGMALTDLGDYKGAIDILNKVVKKEPKWAFAINELGLAYRGDNNFQEAAKQFKLATDKDKSFAKAYYNLGEAYFKYGNLGEARKVWDQLKKMGQTTLAAELDVATNGALRQGS